MKSQDRRSVRRDLRGFLLLSRLLYLFDSCREIGRNAGLVLNVDILWHYANVQAFHVVESSFASNWREVAIE